MCVNIYNLYACAYTELTLRSNAGSPANGKAHAVYQKWCTAKRSYWPYKLEIVKILVVVATNRFHAMKSFVSVACFVLTYRYAMADIAGSSATHST